MKHIETQARDTVYSAKVNGQKDMYADVIRRGEIIAHSKIGLKKTTNDILIGLFLKTIRPDFFKL